MALATLAVIAASEAAFWLGSRLSDRAGTGESCGILVLGYPARADGTLHPVQRLRVDTAVAMYGSAGCDLLVVSGGAVSNEHVEAKVMERRALALGVLPEHLVIDELATNTWENVANALPHLEPRESIYLASGSLHAHRGRRYLCRQRPEACSRVRVAGGYEPFRMLWWKVPAFLYEIRAWIRDRRRCG